MGYERTEGGGGRVKECREEGRDSHLCCCSQPCVSAYVCALYCWFWKSNFDLNWFLLAHFSSREEPGRGEESNNRLLFKLKEIQISIFTYTHTHTMLNISDSGHHILIHYETMRKALRGDSLVAFCCFHLHSAVLQCVCRHECVRVWVWVGVCVCMGVFANVCGHLSKLNSTAVKQGQRYKGVKLVRIALLRIPFPPAPYKRRGTLGFITDFICFVYLRILCCHLRRHW